MKDINDLPRPSLHYLTDQKQPKYYGMNTSRPVISPSGTTPKIKATEFIFLFCGYLVRVEWRVSQSINVRQMDHHGLHAHASYTNEELAQH